MNMERMNNIKVERISNLIEYYSEELAKYQELEEHLSVCNRQMIKALTATVNRLKTMLKEANKQ